jgi:biotin carboxyl carrier protein
MKMEHPVLAPHAGVVREVLVREGQTLEAGTLLLVLDAE